MRCHSNREEEEQHRHQVLLFKNLPGGDTHHVPEELVFGWTLTAQDVPDHAVHVTHVEPHPVQEAQQQGPSCADTFPYQLPWVCTQTALTHFTR